METGGQEQQVRHRPRPPLPPFRPRSTVPRHKESQQVRSCHHQRSLPLPSHALKHLTPTSSHSSSRPPSRSSSRSASDHRESGGLSGRRSLQVQTSQGERAEREEPAGSPHPQGSGSAAAPTMQDSHAASAGAAEESADRGEGVDGRTLPGYYFPSLDFLTAFSVQTCASMQVFTSCKCLSVPTGTELKQSLC